ncbi:hypothetical protein PI125_g19926 [Phytophthora idaei]|nr:hypothetical protein PI125_g19926 [Phytophthora idaei]KAG3135117.1 hypothetical protein PI126_g18386 [Phytophthora idaei]
MLLSTFFVVLLTASLAFAERSALCDDGGPLTCSVTMPDTLSDYRCGTHGLWALQTGCYVCVDATTCVVIDFAISFNEAQQNSLTLPKANGNDISILLQDQADHSPEDPAYEHAAMTNAASPQAEKITKRPEVSNWLFSIPVCLAIVSLGLAIRARIPQRRRGFQRLQDHNRQNRDANPASQDDINPFCSNELEEDVVIETAGHFQGDPSNSESEEAQFLPSEEDAFTLAESEAIKQAVLLHIREFNEQEDEEAEI